MKGFQGGRFYINEWREMFAAGMMTSVDFNRDGNNDVALIAKNSIVMVFTSSGQGER